MKEDLAGASRLMRQAERESGAPGAVVELVRNARRLVDRVSAYADQAPGFLTDDNARLTCIVGPVEGAMNATPAELNEALRAALVERIHELRDSTEQRREIGLYLRRRVHEQTF